MGFRVEYWHFLVDFSDIYLESIHFSLCLSVCLSQSLSPSSWAWEQYCCCSCLRCLLGEEVASVGAWLLSVPGTPHLRLCAADTHYRSSAQLRSVAAQMPEMVHDRVGTCLASRGRCLWEPTTPHQELLSWADAGYCISCSHSVSTTFFSLSHGK